MSLLELFCSVDDAYQNMVNDPTVELLGVPTRRGPKPRLSQSEIATIIICFHQSGYRTFKTFYIKYVCKHMKQEFPQLVSYNRFVELMPHTLKFLCLYLFSRLGKCTGISFVDATPLIICHNKRIFRNKVFKGVAKRGKTSMGWFFGFKLHLIINDKGEILAFALTEGNVDDRKPVREMAKELYGKLFGDKGYISKELRADLMERGVELITSVRKNMKNKLIDLGDKVLLRKRSIIETVNDQLKNISQICHSRHRSGVNFLVNVVSGLIAYCHQPKKPSLNLTKQEISALPALI